MDCLSPHSLVCGRQARKCGDVPGESAKHPMSMGPLSTSNSQLLQQQHGAMPSTPVGFTDPALATMAAVSGYLGYLNHSTVLHFAVKPGLTTSYAAVLSRNNPSNATQRNSNSMRRSPKSAWSMRSSKLSRGFGNCKREVTTVKQTSRPTINDVSILATFVERRITMQKH